MCSKCSRIPGEQGTDVAVPIKSEDVRVTRVIVLSAGDSMYTSISAGRRDIVRVTVFVE